MPKHNINLNHTILYKDIDTIIKNNLIPKISNGMIVCDYMFFFYDDEESLNHDYKTLTQYINEVNTTIKTH
jgi:hypothetical protein